MGPPSLPADTFTSQGHDTDYRKPQWQFDPSTDRPGIMVEITVKRDCLALAYHVDRQLDRNHIADSTVAARDEG